MADSSAIKAGRAFVELFADDTELAKGLRKAEGRLKGFGKSIGTAGMDLFKLGAGGVTALVGLAVASAKGGAEIERLTKITGMSAEELTSLKYAASQTETDFETLTGGITKMHKALGTNSPATQNALKKIGLTTAELMAMSPAERFEAIADGIAKLGNQSDRVAVAMAMFGRSGAQLLPMLERTGGGIRKLRDEAAALGLVMSSQSAKDAAEFDRKMKTLWAVLMSAQKAIGAALIPTLTELTQKVITIAAEVKKWIKEHQGLFVSALKIAASLAAVGIAIVVLGKVFTVAGMAISALRVAFSVTYAVLSFGLGVVKAAIAGWQALVGVIGSIRVLAGAATGIGEFAGALAASYPLAIALGVALVGLGVAAYIAREEIAQAWQTVKEDTLEAVGGIKDAIMAGDIVLAAKIVWAYLKLEWARGVAALLDIWTMLSTWVTKGAYWMFDRVLVGWEYLRHGATTAWNGMLYGLKAGWIAFSSLIQLGWAEIVAAAQKAGVLMRKANPFGDAVDVQAEFTRIDKELTEKKQQITGERDQAKAGMGAFNSAEDNRHQQALQDRKLDAGKMYAQLDQNQNDDITRHQAKVDAAKAELDGLVAQAKAAGNTKKKIGTGEMQGPQLPTAAQVSAGASASVGTFSSAAALNMGSAAPMDKLLQVTHKMAGKTDEIADNTRRAAEAAEDNDGETFQ